MKTTRRSAVLVSGVVVGLAGCTSEVREPGSGDSSASLPTTAATGDSEPDPDRAALDRAIELTLALLAGLAASGPTLDTGGHLTTMHEAHLAVLAEATDQDVTTMSREPGVRLTANQLRRRELGGQLLLARLAQSAQSGALARLLASMSAGIAAAMSQHPEVPR